MQTCLGGTLWFLPFPAMRFGPTFSSPAFSIPAFSVAPVRVCFDPLKCHVLSFRTAIGKLCKFHVIKDERSLVSKMEGRTNFSRRLKQFEGLNWLTQTPLFYDRSTPLGPRVWVQFDEYYTVLYHHNLHSVQRCSGGGGTPRTEPRKLLVNVILKPERLNNKLTYFISCWYFCRNIWK